MVWVFDKGRRMFERQAIRDQVVQQKVNQKLEELIRNADADTST